MNSLKTNWLVAPALAALATCGPREQPRTAEGTMNCFPQHSDAGVPESAPESAPVVSEPAPIEVAILDPARLAELEAQFSLGRLVANTDGRTTAELARTPAFKIIFDVLRGDVQAAARPHPLARVTSMDGFRLFEQKWLDSAEMSFELSGVFNRIDRRPFNPGTCGEIRFVYRLRYSTTQGGAPMSSRLPMTVNTVFLIGEEGDPGCRRAAQAWRSPNAADGPLSPEMRRRWTMKSVEVNLQTIRLQSSVQTTLGGHIEYALRVFHATEGGTFAPAPMENMPDVPALTKNDALRAELLAELKNPETLKALDLGILKLPAKFLATGATSVSPRGLSRLQNRPFRKLFKDSDFADLDLSGYRTLRSPVALLRRLDGASCVGCHQSRSIAGFHHVGNDPESSPRFNSLLSGLSTHLASDLERRREYVTALAEGREPDEYRPIPERQGTGNGHGAPCGLGDPGLSEWSCTEGLSCQRLEEGEVGACFAAPGVGSPCEYGVMLPKPVAHHDYVSKMTAHACAERQSCDTNFQGFPLGSCGARCSAEAPDGVCSDFLDVDGYQNCLRGKISSDECAKKFVFKTGLRQCDAEHPCRQDYVCARSEKDGIGACVPPYFVFQLRLDGYPLPR